MARSTTRRARRRWQEAELQHLWPWMKEQEQQGTTWKVREQNWLKDIGTRRSGPAIQAQWHRQTRKRPLSGHAEDDGNVRVQTIPAEPLRVPSTQQEAAGPASPVTSSSPPRSETVRPSSCTDPAPSGNDEIPPPIEERFWSLIQFVATVWEPKGAKARQSATLQGPGSPGCANPDLGANWVSKNRLEPLVMPLLLSES
ncbi:hypothetical protein BDQ94DRAFT_157654 [Aspergillus welwitschiae]|uniref:Uncharacterized protein n=1 Tax=Aspergillus welwitschiae TaxID=1341132 RepID=A0A3F3QC87_9EURO|nr:hypothetical protein BDQ94DRAFT_157654 [Aspergillus welwitschiae]RDH36813.1 hypothetical protein BDQ94DRAFT_157654 [Aspergillus welwitschiae]